MSDELKNSTVLRGLLEDRQQAVRLKRHDELITKSALHRAEARHQERIASRVAEEAEVVLMEAEIFAAEKLEFCAAAEAEISAAEAAALSPSNTGEGTDQQGSPSPLEEFMKLPGAVKWEGGDCPVPAGRMVEVLLSDLTRDEDIACEWLWSNDPDIFPIIAYRPLEAAADSPEAPGTSDGEGEALAGHADDLDEAIAPDTNTDREPDATEQEREEVVEYEPALSNISENLNTPTPSSEENGEMLTGDEVVSDYDVPPSDPEPAPDLTILERGTLMAINRGTDHVQPGDDLGFDLRDTLARYGLALRGYLNDDLNKPHYTITDKGRALVESFDTAFPHKPRFGIFGNWKHGPEGA